MAGNAVAGRLRDNEVTVCHVEGVRRHDDAPARFERLCSNNTFDLILRANRSDTGLNGKG